MNIFNNNKLSLFPTPGQSALGFRDVKATGSSVPESIKAPVMTPQSFGSGLGSVAAPVRAQLQTYPSSNMVAVPKVTAKLSLNKQTIANLGDSSIAGWFTQGCTDGCTGSATFASAWRCTRGNCTFDCPEPLSACVCKTDINIGANTFIGQLGDPSFDQVWIGEDLANDHPINKKQFTNF